MRNLLQAATVLIVGRCAIVGKDISDQQKEIIAGVIGEVLAVSGDSDDDIIEKYQKGELTEGKAAYWLEIDRLSLRRRLEVEAENAPS